MRVYLAAADGPDIAFAAPLAAPLSWFKGFISFAVPLASPIIILGDSPAWWAVALFSARTLSQRSPKLA